MRIVVLLLLSLVVCPPTLAIDPSSETARILEGKLAIEAIIGKTLVGHSVEGNSALFVSENGSWDGIQTNGKTIHGKWHVNGTLVCFESRDFPLQYQRQCRSLIVSDRIGISSSQDKQVQSFYLLAGNALAWWPLLANIQTNAETLSGAQAANFIVDRTLAEQRFSSSDGSLNVQMVMKFRRSDHKFFALVPVFAAGGDWSIHAELICLELSAAGDNRHCLRVEVRGNVATLKGETGPMNQRPMWSDKPGVFVILAGPSLIDSIFK